MSVSMTSSDTRLLQETTLRRFNQIVYRLAALTWVITQVFDWYLLTMGTEELISSAVSRIAVVGLLWAMAQWIVPRCSWQLSGALFLLINFGSLWGVGNYLWMPSVGTLARHAMMFSLSTLANIFILGVVRSSRLTFAAGAGVVCLWYLLLAPEPVFPRDVAWVLLLFVLGFATLLYFSIEAITRQIFALQAQHRTVLEQEKDNLAAVIQSMADGVVLTDGAGRIEEANDAFAEMSGLDRETLQGRRVADLLLSPPRKDGDGPPPDPLAFPDKVIDREVRIAPPDGEPFQAFLSAATVKRSGSGRRGRVYVLRDARYSPLALRLNVAELKALKAQINPHFLFNTLNTISSLIMTDPEKAETATQLLSMHFRNVLSVSDREWVTLEQEMEFLRAYLEIEQFRHEDRLMVSYRVNPDCLHVRVPTLLLQPIVENAIRHGFRDKTDRWLVEIAVTSEDGYCRISISDNGSGIPPSKQASLFDGEGHGLKNVHQRLRLYYGDQATLAVESRPKEGARFTIHIPHPPEPNPAAAVPA